MKKIMKISLMIFILILTLTACSQGNDDDKKVLVMGTSADYQPFEFYDLTGDEGIIGYDVDIATYVANELGYELKVIDMDFNSLITALRIGKVDMVLAGMSPTPDRAEVVDFSDVYYNAKNMIITRTDLEINSVEDLNGLVIGSQTGSLQEEAVVEIQESGVDIESKTMDRMAELIQQLQAGRVDAIVIEDMITSGYLETYSNLKLVDVLEQEGLGSAIALDKDSELTEQINEILARMQENGELEKIAEKWLN